MNATQQYTIVNEIPSNLNQILRLGRLFREISFQQGELDVYCVYTYILREVIDAPNQSPQAHL